MSPQPQYRLCLEPWVRFARRRMQDSPAGGPASVYAAGDSGHWSTQAHATALAAFAVLAADPATDQTRTGCSREELAQTARHMLRFYCASHCSGDGVCRDGRQWGHGWISALGVERVAHGVRELERLGVLAEDERDAWKRLLASEADWLLDHYPVEADPDNRSGRNKPESNIWNGCVSLRAVLENPEHPRVEAWRDKARRFLLNGISRPSEGDRSGAGARPTGGRLLADWHVGGNFTEEFGLDHHGYLNFGYMVICLSNLALFHLALQERGQEGPEELYHNAAELWRLVRMTISADGRLLRIGGDSRARYCYCQEYLVPVWQLARERFGDDCGAAERGWLEQVTKESAQNADGSFLGTRLAEMRRASPLYYSRLEGDRAAALSVGALWRRLFPATEQNPAPLPARGSWTETMHGAGLVSGEKRFASWVWEAAEKPQGLFLPGARSDMGEWRRNLAGEISGDGGYTDNRTVRGECRSFEDGFVYYGNYQAVTVSPLFEGGENERVIAECQLAGAALPDDGTWIGLQYARSRNGAILTGWRGVNLQLPNDVYNGYRRNYTSAGGAFTSTGLQAGAHAAGDWLCADGALWAGRLYGEGELQIRNPGRRQIGLRPSGYRPFLGQNGGSLGTDEITLGRFDGDPDTVYAPADGTLLFDLGYVLRCGASGADGLRECSRVACRLGSNNTNDGAATGLRAVRVRGADGADYLLAANFGDEAAEFTLLLPETARMRFLGGEDQTGAELRQGRLRLSSCGAVLLALGA